MDYRLYITTRKEWRSWLEVHHSIEKEVWLIYYKKHTGISRIPYDDAVEEALCFGWIDSIVKRIDDERFMQKFSPRNDKSEWSDLNKKRVKKLIKNGLMTEAGLSKIKIAKKNGSWVKSIESLKSFDMPTELEDVLNSNHEANLFFDNLAPSYKKQYINWVASAKKEETRQRRAIKALSLMNQKKKLGEA